MCYDDNARPPLPPGTPGTAHGEDLVLEAADGNRFAAYLAQPDQPATAQILIYPDIRGLHQFYKDLALRFAEQGIAAIAMDYFGRTAGLTARDDAFEFMPHVQQLRPAHVLADAAAAIGRLREGDGAERPTFLTGFCIGGSLTIMSATHDLGLAGAIPFYAGMSRAMNEQGQTALQLADGVRVPLLGLFGGADQGIPVEQVEELDRVLDSTGVEHTIVIYPGAPHSFFDRKATEFAEASTDAWVRVLTFIADHRAA